MTRQRIMLTSIIGIVIFALLLGGKFVYQKKWIDVTIQHQSQQIPGVISAKTVQKNGQDEMVVVTNQISNLRQVSLSLEKIAGKVPIRYLDRSNDSLEKLFGQMQFALQEGIVRGNFTEMAQNVRTQADKAGVQLELEMDSDAIYVILNQGDAQLIEVIERHGQVNFLPSEKE
ncbi:hypothetical protein [Desulfosporosinus sp. Sb-LF]|uniref:hypothetical protein n=1 Tax=Desulfosporosinus sp. Sb-LF TaxID=2560027 RepID=UPI00107F01A5|nr:hypothetical protein [Desulfosporosinus sp. Sb-LF]TGE32258.1 hypothetical protein E4K68_11650 [Desulfosporosinus sp. Sb-LF]